VYDESLLNRGGGRGTGGAPAASGGLAGRAGGSSAGASPRPGSGGATPSNGGSPSTVTGGRPSAGGNSGAQSGGRTATGGSPSAGEGGVPSGEAGAAGSFGVGAGGDGGAPGGGGEAGELGFGGGGAPAGGSSTGGAATGGTQTGGAGETAGGAPGAVESCSGCARLAVALTTQNSHAHFKLSMPAPTDLGSATITFVVRRFAGSGGRLHGFVQSGADFTFHDGVIVELEDIDDAEMQTITWDLAHLPLSARSEVRYVGIQINGLGSDQLTNPTVVYVDSIRITGSSLDRDRWPFDDAESIRTLVEDTCPPCATTGQLWLDSDFTAPATLSWLGE